uniref:Uncharacterized protein LOC100367278 n=1 Tax=Saccoglossus kowalevskii TaxID=10224 RepID=A0ABM0GVP1_SACKO|nr:PREDICTED: uncharacterized protein LOC100367278 [Saccoglossus kowalevskii]
MREDGGTRDIEMPSLEIRTEMILKASIEVFFPNEISTFGKIDDMEYVLGDFCGRKISMFVDQDGGPGTYNDYLKVHGLFTSRNTMYLMTKSKEADEDIDDSQKTGAESDVRVTNTGVSAEVQSLSGGTGVNEGYISMAEANTGIGTEVQSISSGICGVIGETSVAETNSVIGAEMQNLIECTGVDEREISKSEANTGIGTEIHSLIGCIGVDEGKTNVAESNTNVGDEVQSLSCGISIDTQETSVAETITGIGTEIHSLIGCIGVDEGKTSVAETITGIGAEEQSLPGAGGTDVRELTDSGCSTKEGNLDSNSHHLFPLSTEGKIIDNNSILHIRYSTTNESRYSDKVVTLNCFQRSSCREFTEVNCPALKDFNKYDPMNYGFRVTHIVIGIGQTTYLDAAYDECHIYTSYPAHNIKDDIILHHPNEIFGYDGNEFIVGIVTNNHGRDDVMYSWYRDGQLMQYGQHLCVIAVHNPGVYQCKITIGEGEENVADISKPIQIVEFKQPYKRSCSGSYTMDTCSADTSTDNGAIPEITREEFVMTGEIGRGAFGTVFQGEWTGTPVAIKYMQIKRMKRQMLKIVKNEIKVNERIRHPNIVQLISVCYEPSGIYLLSEYIEGYNMEDCAFDDDIKKIMKLSTENKNNIAKQCLQGLAYLHALKPPIVHQDIKPANVVIAAATYLTKICDMGMAKVKSIQSVTSNTMVGYCAGTPSYMAPECLLHKEKAKTASDVWSVGMTLIEFMTEQDAWNIDDDEVEDPLTIILQMMSDKRKPHIKDSMNHYNILNRFV